jgi:ketosteroid isomerase-like protein
VSENLDLVRSILEAWARRDYEWIEWADPAIEFVVADGPSPGHYIGLAAMSEGWRDVLSPWEDWRTEELDYRVVDEERVLAVFTFSGRGKASGLDVAQVTRKGATVFQIRDGKVIRLLAYFDRDRAVADLGLEV